VPPRRRAGPRGRSVPKVTEGADDLPGFSAGAVVGMDVDPPYGPVGVEDDGGGHRRGVSAIGVNAGQVKPELQLSGTRIVGQPDQKLVPRSREMSDEQKYHAADGETYCNQPEGGQVNEYNQRLKAAAPLMEAALGWLADQTPGAAEMLRLMEATPVPCGQSAITAKRSDLYGHAGYGYCPSHSRWYGQQAPAHRYLRRDRHRVRPGQSEAGRRARAGPAEAARRAAVPAGGHGGIERAPSWVHSDGRQAAPDVTAQQLAVVGPSQVQRQLPVCVVGDHDVGRGRAGSGSPGCERGFPPARGGGSPGQVLREDPPGWRKPGVPVAYGGCERRGEASP
jgi:hypothetical protein